MKTTQGLIALRSNDIENGRLLYSMAIKGFEKMGDNRSAAVATYFWAVEEKRIRIQTAASIIEEAKKRISHYHVLEYEDLVKRL